MRKILILLVAGILIVAFIPSVCTWGDCFYEWQFDIKATGTVHVELDVHLRDIDFALEAWDLSFDIKWEEKITNMEAYESKTHKEMNIDAAKFSRNVRYFFVFDRRNPKEDVDFTVEFDLNDAFVEIMEGVNYFEWTVSTSENFMRHIMDATLPSGTEVVFVSEAQPLGFAERRGSAAIHFEEESKGLGVNIKMGIAFSEVGKSSLEKAEKAFSSENYEDAQSYYKSALTFYESLSVLYGKTTDQFLSQLSEDFDLSLTPTFFQFSTISDYVQFLSQIREKITLCQEEAEEAETDVAETEANATFSEVLELFRSGSYEAAQNAFEKAQSLYTSLGNDEKASECQDYADQCTQLREEQEADSLFDQGKRAFEEGSLEDALELFRQAKEKYLDIGSEKATECDEWIRKIQAELEAENGDEEGF